MSASGPQPHLTRVDARQSDGCVVFLPEVTVTIRCDPVTPETQIILSEPLDHARALGSRQRMEFRWKFFERFGERPAQLAVQVRQP